MNKDLIDKAAQVLRIETVSLRNASITLKEGFDPPFAEADVRVVPQYRIGPAGTFRVIDHAESATGRARKIVVFRFEAGVRLADETKLAALEENADDIGEAAVYVEITAQFSARYSLTKEAHDDDLEDALREFERYNAGFQVWPYWREYVQSMCARIGIPPIPIPMYQIPNCDAE